MIPGMILAKDRAEITGDGDEQPQVQTHQGNGIHANGLAQHIQHQVAILTEDGESPADMKLTFRSTVPATRMSTVWLLVRRTLKKVCGGQNVPRVRIDRMEMEEEFPG